MGSEDRKKMIRDIRRKDIVDAGERVFFTKGFAAATMDEIAKEAQYSKRTVYLYISSKEEIYYEIMLRGYSLLHALLEERTKALGNIPALEVLRNLGTTFYDFSVSYPDHFRAIMEYETQEEDFSAAAGNQPREACYAQGEVILQYMMNALKQGIADGSLRRDLEVVDTALFLWSGIIGVFGTLQRKSLYIANYHKREPRTFIESSFELFAAAIKKA